jgi:hypothetical protein
MLGKNITTITIEEKLDHNNRQIKINIKENTIIADMIIEIN